METLYILHHGGALGVVMLLLSFQLGNSTFVLSSSSDPEFEGNEFDQSQRPHVRNKRVVNVEIPENYSVYALPPTPNGGPLSVKMSVVIMNVRDIKEIGEEISIELNIRVSWKDPRLAHIVSHLVNSPSPSNEVEFVLLPPSLLKSIWQPDLFMDHVKKVEQPTIMSPTASLRMYPDNTLRYSARLTIAMACSMDFRFYPADTQSCNFDIKSYAYSDSKMVLAWVEKNGAFFAYPVALSNFFVGLDNPNAFTHKTTSRSYSALRFTVLLTRKLSYHLIQTYLPSIILVIVSWLSFLVNLDAIPGRMTLVMTCLLTLIAMFSAVRTSTPNVSYVKAIDIWMVVCVFFVFLALMEFTFLLKVRSIKFKTKEVSPGESHNVPNVGRNYSNSLRGPRGGGVSVTSVYYPNPPPPIPPQNRRFSNPRAGFGQESIDEEDTEFGEYLVTRRASSDYGGDGSVQRRGFPPGEQPGLYSRPLLMKPAVAEQYPNIPPFVPATVPKNPPPPPTTNDKIITKVELLAPIIFPIIFLVFNFLYWPWLIISSGYYDQEGVA